jgi:hypothetical protein
VETTATFDDDHQETFVYIQQNVRASRTNSIASTPLDDKKNYRGIQPTNRSNFSHLTTFAQKISTLSSAGDVGEASEQNTKLLREMKSTSTWRYAHGHSLTF